MGTIITWVNILTIATTFSCIQLADDNSKCEYKLFYETPIIQQAQDQDIIFKLTNALYGNAFATSTATVSFVGNL